MNTRTPYQLSAAASKDNAFCWLAWKPQIRWQAGAESAVTGDGGVKPQGKVERMRKALETGPKDSAYLAEVAGLKDRTTVYSYLRHDIRAGTIASHRGTFSSTGREKKAA
jgi:hypothetical protein